MEDFVESVTAFDGAETHSSIEEWVALAWGPLDSEESMEADCKRELELALESERSLLQECDGADLESGSLCDGGKCHAKAELSALLPESPAEEAAHEAPTAVAAASGKEPVCQLLASPTHVPSLAEKQCRPFVKSLPVLLPFKASTMPFSPSHSARYTKSMVQDLPAPQSPMSVSLSACSAVGAARPCPQNNDHIVRELASAVRAVALHRYRMKKQRRAHRSTDSVPVKYAQRAAAAKSRKRVGGRFVSNNASSH